MNANSSNLEVFNFAKKMLTDEYVNKRNSEYSNWKSGYENAWKTQTVIIPFPPFVANAAFVPFRPSVQPPSDNDIIAKALELINNANIKHGPIDMTVAADTGTTNDTQPTDVGTIESPGDAPPSITDPIEFPIVPDGHGESAGDSTDTESVDINTESERVEDDVSVPSVGDTAEDQTRPAEPEIVPVELTSTIQDIFKDVGPTAPDEIPLPEIVDPFVTVPLQSIASPVDTVPTVPTAAPPVVDTAAPPVELNPILEIFKDIGTTNPYEVSSPPPVVDDKIIQLNEMLAKAQPQPAEELAKVQSSRILPSIIKRLQDITGLRSS